MKKQRCRKTNAVMLLASVFLLSSRFCNAQPVKKLIKIGVVAASSAAAGTRNLEAFRQGLRDLGYREGENIHIEARWADGWNERLPGLIAELTQLNVDLMLVSGATAALVAKNAKLNVPVVFAAVTDPFEHGLIESLARPGRNMTGTALAVGEGFSGKWVELLKETVPKVTSFAALFNPTHPVSKVFLRESEAAAKAFSVRLHFFEARDPGQLDLTLSNIAKERTGALLVLPDPLFFSQRKVIADFATRRHLPSIFLFREFAEAGGLMSYGPNIADSYRRAAMYVDKILKGAKPADLPVEQPTRFEFVINLTAAKQIGLTVPPNVLARADRVIR